MIPVNRPIVSREAKVNVNKALDDCWLSSSGSFVKEFEDKFAKWLGVKYAIAVSSGTAALHIALRALGIKEGDEVIVPALTMGSTWMAVLYTGAKPVFVDCDLKDWNIDINQIGRAITSRTKAIIPVHIYGQACDMRLMDIARHRGLKVVEDACEAIGTLYHEQRCGTFGDINCFSFFANKVISTGEGGMAVTNNETYAEKLRRLRDLCHSDKRFIHDDIGYNYRMTNLQAAVGCGEMEHIDEYIRRKLEIAEFYNENLKDINGIQIPQVIRGRDNSYWMYGILIDKLSYGMDRDELREALKEKGIETRDFFYPPDQQPILNGKQFINATYLSRNGLYLPSGLGNTDEELTYVVEVIKSLYACG